MQPAANVCTRLAEEPLKFCKSQRYAFTQKMEQHTHTRRHVSIALKQGIQGQVRTTPFRQQQFEPPIAQIGNAASFHSPFPCQCTVVRLAGARNRRERLHCFPVVSEVPFVGHEADDSGRDLCSDRMNGNTELLYISRRGAQCSPVIGKAFRDQRAGCRQPRQTGSRCRYRRRADAGSSRTKLARC